MCVSPPFSCVWRLLPSSWFSSASSVLRSLTSVLYLGFFSFSWFPFFGSGSPWAASFCFLLCLSPLSSFFLLSVRPLLGAVAVTLPKKKKKKRALRKGSQQMLTTARAAPPKIEKGNLQRRIIIQRIVSHAIRLAPSPPEFFWGQPLYRQQSPHQIPYYHCCRCSIVFYLFLWSYLSFLLHGGIIVQ